MKSFLVAGAAVVLGVAGVGAYEKWGKGGEDHTTRNETGQIVDTGDLGVFRINAGDCFDSVMGGISTTKGIPCDSPHKFEAVGEYTLVGDTYTSADEYVTESVDKCLPITVSYSNRSREELVSLWPEIYGQGIVPTADSWGAGDRTVTCYVALSSSQLFLSSIKND